MLGTSKGSTAMSPKTTSTIYRERLGKIIDSISEHKVFPKLSCVYAM